MKAELFEVKIIEEVVIKGNSREGYCNLFYMPRLGCNLLGRDLQVQLGVGVILHEGRMVAEVMLMREENKSEIEGGVWAEEGNRGLLDIRPIKVEMETGIPLIRVKQYPILAERRRGLTPIIRNLIQKGILEPCMSPYNTPVIPMKKPNGTTV